MDDTQRNTPNLIHWFHVGLAGLVLCVAGAFTDLTHAEADYVSPAQITEMQTQFEAARMDDPSVLTAHAWTCDMFGVHTHLYVERDLKLYAFRRNDASTDKSDPTFANTGGAPHETYRIKDQTLEARDYKQTLDQVRVMKDGRLISRLSVPARGITVAYAICRGS